MSKFLEYMVRSEGKSCEGKIQFPREDSAERSARDMERKKGNGEIFEHYKCSFGDHWHIGHRTSFDWIPASHAAYTMLLHKYKCGCGASFIANTVFSNRVLARFKNLHLGEESEVRCPFCKNVDGFEFHGRRWVKLEEIPEDSTEPIESLWERYAHTDVPFLRMEDFF